MHSCSRFLVAFLLCGAALLSRSVLADDAPSKEYLVKAGFLYNFTKFIEWPQPGAEFRICIAGPNPFGGTLKAIEKKSTPSRSYKIIHEAANLAECQIAYFTGNGGGTQAKQLAGSPILTVGDGENFIRSGGAIAFVQAENKIKLVISQSALKRAGLRVDSQLLEVALKVIE